VGKKSSHILFGRTARNISFWVAFTFFQLLRFFTADEFSTGEFLFSLRFYLLQSLLLCGVVYFNNLYLIPTFFQKKKYAVYFLFLLLWMLLNAKAVELFYDYFLKSYPEFFSDAGRNISDMPYIAALFLVGLFLFGFTMAKFANDYFVREDAVKQMEKKQVESELNFLKAQINPHFLFNTLNSIYSLALKKSEQTADVVLRLSDLLRYILYECNVDQISLGKEIETIKNYVELEKIRTCGADRIRFSVSGNPEGILVAPLIWIALVENAFKHGMGSLAKDGFVHVDMQITAEHVRFTCLNNYAANNPTETEVFQNGGGIGLDNLKKRLRLLYPDRHRLIMEKKSDTFYVELIIKTDTL
jgi:two-component system LytT family sensor kinase